MNADQPNGEPRSEAVPAGRIRPNRVLFMVVLVIIAAGVALLVIDRRGPTPLPTVPLEPEAAPDFYMEGAMVEQFRADGTLEYQLTSHDVRHFEQQARTRLIRPQLTLHDPDGTPWQASAEVGVLRRPPRGADEETLTLRGDVVLEQTRPDGDFVRLRTPRLDIYPRRQYAQTNRDVMIESLVGRTAATGLEGDLQLGLLTFHSGAQEPVHTVLEPRQFK